MLVFDTLIDSQENIKFGRFRRVKELAILPSSQPSITDCLAIVAAQQGPESLIDTFIDQNAHLGTSEQKLLSLFERCDRQFTRDGRESFQKIFQRFPALQVVEKRLRRHPRSTKHRRSAKNFRVFDNNPHQPIVACVAF